MGSFFDNLTVVDDQDLIGIADCAQAVGDDKTGAPLHQPQERLLDACFGACVNAARCFVENQDARVGEDGASNRQ